MASVTIGDPKHNLNNRYAGVSAPVDPAVGPGAALVQRHNSDKPGYVVNFNEAPTVALQLAVIESGTVRRTRLRRVVITSPGLQTAAGLIVLQLLRTTTASSAGTAVVPPPLDQQDTAFSGIARRSPTAGTEAAVLYEFAIFVPAAVADFLPKVFDFGGPSGILRDPSISIGAANGLALKHPGSAGAAGFRGYIEFTEEDA
jgi:hypothetical protein